MTNDYKQELIAQIIDREDPKGCWNVLPSAHPHYHDWNYYVPTYNATLWTLVFIADIDSDCPKERFLVPLRIITEYFHDPDNGIFTMGKSHFPIPCLNGNMLYLLNYFDSGKDALINGAVDFFAEYQRFDDGDYKTPSTHPYYSNKSCYGKHTCYWGVVKLLKGLSFIPNAQRTPQAKQLIEKCIEFILKHSVCHSSHDPGKFLQKNIEKLAFPNMYKADFLEILWILKREQVRSDSMTLALELLRNKKNSKGLWEIEHPIKNLVIPFGKKTFANNLITERAQEVCDYYGCP
jgi:hypothetical protein